MSRTYTEPIYAERAVELYVKGGKTKDILDELAISSSQLYNVLKRRGLYEPKKRDKTEVVVCPHCHSDKNPIGAKYCCFCGEDIRSHGVRAADMLGKVVKNIVTFFPTTEVDNAMGIIAEAQKLLRSK